MKINAFLYFLLISCSASAQNFQDIKNYRVSYAVINQNGTDLIAMRSFSSKGIGYRLLLDPQKLSTKIALAEGQHLSKVSLAKACQIFSKSAYATALNKVFANDQSIQNAGIDHAIPKEKGIILTIDLCPSHQNLDRIIFQALINEFKKIQQPVPVAISVAGKWMLKHNDDLQWLKNLVAEQQLDITWINHSFNYEVNNLPLSENFLLTKGTNLDTEVLENEKLMLKNGLVPSVFFRFPGLVSDQQIVTKIINYGLIPVGSDAWLAKGQQPNAGSIVLIHGNGNEEIGVKDFINLLQQKKVEVIHKQWLLFDLRTSM